MAQDRSCLVAEREVRDKAQILVSSLHHLLESFSAR